MRYTFPPNPRKPGYVNIVDPSGNLIGEFWWEDHGMLIVGVYENMHRQNERRANEFMYGHLLGMALVLGNVDRYPRMKQWVNDQGVLMIRSEDPVTGAVWEGAAASHPGAGVHIQTIMRKAFGRDE